MAKIKFEHMTNHAPDKAFTLLKNFLANDPEFKRFDPKMKLDFSENTNQISIKSAQFSANINILPAPEPQKGSHLAIDLNLTLMLSPFKNKIQETLERKLSKYLS